MEFDYNKLVKIIESCTQPEHFNVLDKMMINFYKKHIDNPYLESTFTKLIEMIECKFDSVNCEV